MTDYIFTKYHSGNCILQELEWMNLHCSNCGSEMPKYSNYDNNHNEIKTCSKCGEKHILIRHLPKGLKGDYKL